MKPIPDKYRYSKHLISQINTNDLTELWSFFVRRMYFYNTENEFLNHIQMSNLVFKEKDSQFLRQILNSYKNYFEYRGTKKRLNFEKICNEHPYIWGEEVILDKSFENIKTEFCSAIQSEIQEVRSKSGENRLGIFNISLITKIGSSNIYQANLIIENDDYIGISEGLNATLRTSVNHKFFITLLELNITTESIAFQTTQSITGKTGYIYYSSERILKELLKKIQLIEEKDFPVWKLLMKKELPTPVNFKSKIWGNNLDPSQYKALTNSLFNDITYIWGPPGTGKTHTLSRILLNLYNENEKTLVCSIANIALDGLLLNTINLLSDEYIDYSDHNILDDRKILRLGYNQSDAVRRCKEINFENPALLKLSERIQKLNEEISLIELDKETEHRLELLSIRDSLKRDYDNLLKIHLSNAKIIFVTASKFTIENAFSDLEFDNLVIDEGSMMSMPYLLTLGRNVSKRIIIAGDDNQLGPIAISQSQASQLWLHSDLFQLIRNNPFEKSSNAIQMLTSQRRTAGTVANMYNSVFYEGKLETCDSASHFDHYHFPPKTGHICFVNLNNCPENTTNYSKSNSRYNSFSRRKIVDIIKSIVEFKSDFGTIGIITPYRQQVLDIRRDIIDNGWDSLNIKVGTIHTFQGSECDIIVWDVVDTVNEPIGRLYYGKTGERLVNVALSRTKNKLIIVGYAQVFNEGKGCDNVSSKVKKIVNMAYDYSRRNQ